MGEMKYSNLFLMHIPKTGGSYVTFKALAHECATKPKLIMKNLDHTQKRFYTHGHFHCLQNESFYYDGQDVFKGKYHECENFNDSLRFSIVRNPFDLLVSLYFYKFPYNPANCKDFQDITWEEFARQFCDPSLEWSSQPNSPLEKFLFFSIFSDDGSCQAHRILRMETLDRDLAEVCKIVGISPRFSSEKYNSMDRDHILKAGYHIKDASSGRDPDWRVYYTPELRALAEKKFEKEMKAFGYSFDGFDDFKIDPTTIRYKYSTNTLTLKNR